MIIEKDLSDCKDALFFFFLKHLTLPPQTPSQPSLLPSPVSSCPYLPPPRCSVLYQGSIIQCFMLEFLLVFILLVGKPCLCWKKEWYIWPYVLFIEDSMIKCAKNKQTKLNSWQVCLIFIDLLCLIIKVQKLG